MTVRVLVAEDSPIWEAAWREALCDRADIDVLDIVGDGESAVAAVRHMKPDVLLLDLHLPKLRGLDAIAQIMSQSPTPILCTTSDPGQELAFAALARGALDLTPKPARLPISQSFAESLRRRLEQLAKVPVIRLVAPRKDRERAARARSQRAAIIGVAASTGGPAALRSLVSSLSDESPPLVAVQHMAADFLETFTRWLSQTTEREVALASHGELLRTGMVRLAPDGVHLTVDSAGRTRLLRPAPDDPCRHVPSGDQLLSSLAESFGSQAVGVVLTGMGEDGAAGLGAMQRAGARTLAQDQESSVVYGMPCAAYESGAAQEVRSLDELAQVLSSLRAVTKEMDR